MGYSEWHKRPQPVRPTASGLLNGQKKGQVLRSLDRLSVFTVANHIGLMNAPSSLLCEPGEKN